MANFEIVYDIDGEEYVGSTYHDERIQPGRKGAREFEAVDITKLKRLVYPKKPRVFLTDQQLLSLPTGSEMMTDIELYRNFFYAGFKHKTTGCYAFEEYSADRPLNVERLLWILWHFKLITFNGNHFDLPLLEKACKGSYSTEALHEYAMELIRSEYAPRLSETFNTIDLIEVCPLRGSLKLYTARLHAERIQELPISPHSLLTRDDAEVIRDYNGNDLDNTDLLYDELAEPIKMREGLSKQFGRDLRSMSDESIAETVIGTEFKNRRGHWPRKTKFDNIDRTPRYYTPPQYIGFETPVLQKAFQMVLDARFEIDAAGYPRMPSTWDAVGGGKTNITYQRGLSLSLGHQRYELKMGGLHSTETCVAYETGNDHLLLDFDVSSYYPMIILNGGIYPSNMGTEFLSIYQSIVERRIAAKRAGNSVEADGLKITTNGTFGKTGNPYSIMYSPELMLYITLTGQLMLLMLIEAATLQGFHVVSANTDGIVFWLLKSREAELKAIVKMWEQRTGFILEETQYNAYYARDVNAYIAVKTDGKCKLKGKYSDKGSARNSHLSKNPESYICSLAVQAFLTKGTSVEETIYACNDIRQFVCIQNVHGGAYKDGTYLGRVVRWYYANDEYGSINRCLTGKKVARTDGAKPLMLMDGSMPTDLNRQHYVDQAIAMLYEIGKLKAPQQRLPLG